MEWADRKVDKPTYPLHRPRAEILENDRRSAMIMLPILMYPPSRKRIPIGDAEHVGITCFLAVLDAQLTAIPRWVTCPLPWEDWLTSGRAAQGARSTHSALTFDDGYLSNPRYRMGPCCGAWYDGKRVSWLRISKAVEEPFGCWRRQVPRLGPVGIGAMQAGGILFGFTPVHTFG